MSSEDNFEAMKGDMDFSIKDANKLWRVLRRQERVIRKKRSWLIGLSATSIHESSQLMFQKPKLISKKRLLLESCVRSDEVSCVAVIENVERCFGSFKNKGSHHIVQDYLEVFEECKMEYYAENPFYFLKPFNSIFGDLNVEALNHVANLVTDNKVAFKKTLSQIKRIIEHNLPAFLVESSYMDRLCLLKKLAEVFKNPNSFPQGKILTVLAPVSAPLIQSIKRLMKGLSKLPSLTIIAMSRKLKGVAEVPKLPAGHVYNRKIISEVENECFKRLPKLKTGIALPECFAKALSVMLLSHEIKQRSSDITWLEFFRFPPEVVRLQRDFLSALWSLQEKNSTDLLGDLQSLLDPDARLSVFTIKTVKEYLMEYLFQCDEIDVPDEILRVLDCVNNKFRCGILTREMREQEAETVLSVSCPLHQILSQILSDRGIREDLSGEFTETMGGDDDPEENDFAFTGNNYGSRDSTPSDTAPFSCDENFGVSYLNEPISASTSGPNVVLSSEESLKIEHQRAMEGIQVICDETSLVAHQLVTRFVDELLQMEEKLAVEGKSIDFKEDPRVSILFKTMEELLPSEKYSVGRIKKTMGFM